MISIEIVEKAAILAYCSPWEGVALSIEDWNREPHEDRVTYRNEARAVLEYAATLGPIREERLARYRCAAPAVLVAKGPLTDWDATDIASEIEDIAHAMLAAERPAEPDTDDTEKIIYDMEIKIQALRSGIRNAIAMLDGSGVDRDVNVDALRALLDDKEAP